MKLVKFTVSEQLLKDALHMPDDCRITQAGINYRNGYSDLVLIVMIPGEVAKNEPVNNPIEVNPIVRFEPEKYTFDWNLPKEK